MKPIQQVVPGILKSIAYKRGFSAPQIILEWEMIVGQQVSTYCRPIRVTYPFGKRSEGNLELAILPAWATVVSQNVQLYIDRINVYFGYQAIKSVKLFHTLKIKKRPKR